MNNYTYFLKYRRYSIDMNTSPYCINVVKSPTSDVIWPEKEYIGLTQILGVYKVEFDVSRLLGHHKETCREQSCKAIKTVYVYQCTWKGRLIVSSIHLSKMLNALLTS